MRSYTLNPTSHFRSAAPAPKSGTGLQPVAPATARPSRPMPPNGGRLGGVLSNDQKAALCILCKQAWDALHPSSLNLPTSAMDDFRHAQCMLAVGKPGLTACVQDDYRPLRAHFNNLLGRTGAALNDHLAHATEPKRVAFHKLNEALARAGLPIAYAAAIAKRQHKVTLDELSVKQVWNLVFTINNRGTAKRRKSQC